MTENIENAVSQALGVKMGQTSTVTPTPEQGVSETNQEVGEQLLGFVKTVEEDISAHVGSMQAARRFADPFRQELFLKEQILLSHHQDLRDKAALLLQEMRDLAVTIQNIRETIKNLDSDKYRS